MTFAAWAINTAICISVGCSLGYIAVCGMERIRKNGKLLGKVKNK